MHETAPVKWHVRLQCEGTRILRPSRIVTEDRKLTRPGLREAQFADRGQAFSKGD